MNIKKIEFITVEEALQWSDKHQKLTSRGARIVHIKQLLSQAIKQVVESVPAKGYKVINYKKEKYLEFIDSPSSGETIRRWGYNQHVKEINQWKEKILKELKEEK